jgi:hypothetical protein
MMPKNKIDKFAALDLIHRLCVDKNICENNRSMLNFKAFEFFCKNDLASIEDLVNIVKDQIHARKIGLRYLHDYINKNWPKGDFV